MLGGYISYATNVAPNGCVCGRIALNSSIQYFILDNNNGHLNEVEVHDLKASYDPQA